MIVFKVCVYDGLTFPVMSRGLHMYSTYVEPHAAE